MQFVDDDLKSIQEARVLVESARDAQILLKEYDQKTIDCMIKQIIKNIEMVLPELVSFEVATTGKGNQEDKLFLWQNFLYQFTSSLEEKVIGILDCENSHVQKIGVPLGVVAAILPEENIILNAIFSMISALKAGNAVILIPQGKSAKVVAKLFQLIQKDNVGLPKSSYCFMENTAPEGIRAIIEQESISLVINSAAPKYFDWKNRPKATIYGASGSTPVFIERTANIHEACESIINSRSFDNGLLPSAEQFVIAESVVAKEVKTLMIQAGAHFMTATEEKQLLKVLFIGSKVNPQVIGKDAGTIAALAGFSVVAKTKVLVSEQPYIFDENPFASALKCPILTFYLESDWIHACDKCIQLLKEKGNGHTLAIHSNDQRVINEFALKKPVGRMLVNTGASLAGIGLDATLPLSMILGGMTTGRGYVAKNVTAKDMSYVREIGYDNKKAKLVIPSEKKSSKGVAEDEQMLLEKLLQKIIEQ